MEQLSKNKNLWEKIQMNSVVCYNDIESFIYKKEFILAFNNHDFNFNENIYNDDLYVYSFEVEDYNNEDDYEEVFFQRYLEGDITEKYYKHYEEKFIEFMRTLFEISDAYTYYYMEIPLQDIEPAKFSKDVLCDINKIKLNNDKFKHIDNWNLFKQICYIAAREIDSVSFVFPNIQAVLINSGLHGELISDKPLSNELVEKLKNIVHFSFE